jgi:putative hemolysin
MKKELIILVLVIFLINGCVKQATEEKPEGQAQIANPASVYCEEQGGTLEIRTAADGSQSGYCIFNDGTECEEWAYFRGECLEKEQQRKCNGEGEFCGGIAGIICCEGSCQYDGDYPDAGGTCVKGLIRKTV